MASVGSILEEQKIRIPHQHQMGCKRQVKLPKALETQATAAWLPVTGEVAQHGHLFAVPSIFKI